ncbi:MAG: hypothetical protein A4E53_02334 [Pelotomaculum sp. PtaB.Bin104]|nr:MAG: hypothetical protein A4E53_02334 [Pelotomaculum sp. PtaB.Bin104]
MKRVKDATAVMLAVGMLLSTTTAWAAEKEASSVQEVIGGIEIEQLTDEDAEQPVAKVELNKSQRQALEKICQIMPELKELSVEYVYDEGETIWAVTLSDNTGDAAPGVMHARLAFETNTGNLIEFDIQNPDWVSVELPTSGLAKEKAAEFARQVLEDKIKDYQMSNQISYGVGCSWDEKGNEIPWASANVQFERLVNGIPFLGPGIRVSVDAAGHVTEYYIEGYYERSDSKKDNDLDLALFPDPSLAVTREAAEKIYADLLEMKLNYVERQPMQYPGFGNEEVDTRPVLKYTPTITYAFIDAVTGKPLDESQEQQSTSLISLAGEGKKFFTGTPEEAVALLVAETGIDISGIKFNGEEEREEHLEPGVKVKEYNWCSNRRSFQSRF